MPREQLELALKFGSHASSPAAEPTSRMAQRPPAASPRPNLAADPEDIIDDAADVVDDDHGRSWEHSIDQRSADPQRHDDDERLDPDDLYGRPLISREPQGCYQGTYYPEEDAEQGEENDPDARWLRLAQEEAGERGALELVPPEPQIVQARAASQGTD